MSAAERAGAWVLVLVTVLWGVSFPLVGDVAAGRDQPQLVYFLCLRFSLASVAFLPIARRIAGASEGRGALPWLLSLGLGALLFVSFYLQTVGLGITTPSRSAFITMLSVPMVPFLAALARRRAPSWVHVAGSLVATAGVALVLAPEGRLAPNRGDFLTLASACVFAIEILALEFVTRRAPAVIVAFGQVLGVALFAGLALCFLPLEVPEVWPGLTRGVLVTGIFCTTLALGGMTWGTARVRAEWAAVIFALEPICAALFEWGLQGRVMSATQWAGGGVVVAAVAVSSWFSGGGPGAEERPA